MQTLREMNVSDKYNPARSDSVSASQPAPGDVAPKGTPGTGEAICPECDGTGKINGKRWQNCARPARTSPLARPSQANLRNNAADPVLRHCAVAGSGLFRSRPLAGRATSADKRPPRAR